MAPPNDPDAGSSQLLAQALSVVRSAAAGIAGFFSAHLTVVFVLLLAILLFRSPLTRALVRLLTPRPVLSGKLSRISLSEVLSLLNAEPHTGVLTIRSPECRGKVQFEDGEPYHCVCAKRHGVEALNHLLTNADDGFFAFVEKPASGRRTIETPLSLILMDQAASESDVGGRSTRPSTRSRMKELLDSGKR